MFRHQQFFPLLKLLPNKRTSNGKIGGSCTCAPLAIFFATMAKLSTNTKCYLNFDANRQMAKKCHGSR